MTPAPLTPGSGPAAPAVRPLLRPGGGGARGRRLPAGAVHPDPGESPGRAASPRRGPLRLRPARPLRDQRRAGRRRLIAAHRLQPPRNFASRLFRRGDRSLAAAFATLSISAAALVEIETETKLPVKGVCVGETAVPLVRQLLAEARRAGRAFVLRRAKNFASSCCNAPASRATRRSALPLPGCGGRGSCLRDTCLDAAPRSVGEVAAELGVHPVHLARRFRAAFGLSPGEYVRRCRLDRARRMMQRVRGAAGGDRRCRRLRRPESFQQRISEALRRQPRSLPPRRRLQP